MNFQRGKQNDEPEINLVPMIDVLLVILIFLVVTTTYSKFAQLEINLPQAGIEEVNENKFARRIAGCCAKHDRSIHHHKR